MKFLVSVFAFMIFTQVAVSQINNEHLNIGDDAPLITGVDQFNNEINSNEILKNDKILLLFYRGNWCPYCKKHLGELEKNLENLSKKGVYVIVVTPEKPEKIKETSKKINANFSIVFDKDNSIMNTYKVAFEVNETNVSNYFSATMKRISDYNVENNNVLPVPATYIINKNKKIDFVHYDPKYSNRAKFEDILLKL